MADDDKNFKYALLGMVAIVAIVGCVILIEDGTTSVASSASAENMQGYAFGNTNTYDCWIAGSIRYGGCGTHSGSVLAQGCRDAGGTCHSPSERPSD